MSISLSVCSFICPLLGLSKGYEGQLEGFEGQVEGSDGQVEGSEGWPEGSEGRAERSECAPVGCEGQPKVVLDASRAYY